MGFLGAMKITGNLNREFFAELIKIGPAGRTAPPLHQQQQTDTESSNKSVMPTDNLRLRNWFLMIEV